MQERVAAIRAGTANELVWLVEHPPLYTAGTSARPEELTDPDRFPTFATGRGGQWTYHGPGQRVAYVMLDLTRPHGTVPRARRALLRPRPGGMADPRPRPPRRARRTARRPHRHLGRRASHRHRGQDRRHRRARVPLGKLAWRGAERRARPRPLRRHRPVRHQRARRHQPPRTRPSGYHGGGGRRPARCLARSVRRRRRASNPSR